MTIIGCNYRSPKKQNIKNQNPKDSVPAMEQLNGDETIEIMKSISVHKDNLRDLEET